MNMLPTVGGLYNQGACCIFMKSRRQARILELIEKESVRSQEQLRRRLQAEGVQATQATLSRDIRDLGLVKRASDGAYRPAGSVEVDTRAEAQLEEAVAEYLQSVEAVEQLIILKTAPGQAQALAVVIDRTRLPDVAGTIGGDDTILMICRSAAGAAALVDRLRTMGNL